MTQFSKHNFVFSFLHQLSTWHCSHSLLRTSRAAIIRYLLPARPTAANPVLWRTLQMTGRTDRLTPNSFIDPALHPMPAVPTKEIKKVAHTRLPSVGFRSWSRFLAVSLQVSWVINPVVGCHYFPPGLQLPRYQSGCLVNRGTVGVNSLPKTVTRQRRDLNPGLLRPSPAR